MDNLIDNTQDQQPVRRGLGLGSIVLILGILSVIGVVGAQLHNRGQTTRTSGPAPDFTITTYHGETFRLADQRGKVVVLNFWGSWCGPCRDEAPDLQAVHEAYGDDIVMVGVTYLDNDVRAVMAFIEEYGLTYLNGPDDRLRIADSYRITGAPETFVIDQDGRIVRHFLGQIVRISDLTTLLDSLVAPESSS